MTESGEPTRAIRPGKPADALSQGLMQLIAAVPSTQERPSGTPHERAAAIQRAAALRTAALSGALALPPGPYGLATVLPDLLAVWRIQAQMVADIAGAFGRTASLGSEQMLYCLFRHAAAQALVDLVVRVGKRVIFRQATFATLQATVRKLGLKITERALARGIARSVPAIGSLGAAGFAYYDTIRVGSTALQLIQQELGHADAKSGYELAPETASSDGAQRAWGGLNAPDPG